MPLSIVSPGLETEIYLKNFVLKQKAWAAVTNTSFLIRCWGLEPMIGQACLKEASSTNKSLLLLVFNNCV